MSNKNELLKFLEKINDTLVDYPEISGDLGDDYSKYSNKINSILNGFISFVTNFMQNGNERLEKKLIELKDKKESLLTLNKKNSDVLSDISNLDKELSNIEKYISLVALLKKSENISDNSFLRAILNSQIDWSEDSSKELLDVQGEIKKLLKKEEDLIAKAVKERENIVKSWKS